MTQNIKPLIEQIKQTFSDKEQVRSAFLKTKNTVESKAKLLLEQTRESRIVNEYVVPLLQSEKTEQAIQRLGQKVSQVSHATKLTTQLSDKLDLGAKLEKYRQDLIHFAKNPVGVAEDAGPTETPVETDTTVRKTDSVESEKPQPKVKRSRSTGAESKA